MPIVTCARCGKQFHKKPSKIKRAKNHYCSFECRKAIHFITCEWCGKRAVATRHGSGRYIQRFCSVICRNKALAFKQRKRTTINCDHCGSEFETPIYRLHQAILHFCSMDCKNKYHSSAMSSVGNPRWNGGHSGYRGQDWQSIRKIVLKRDNYICQGCGMSNGKCIEQFGGSLQIHHIISYAETKANYINNLISLCNSCHSKVEFGVIPCPPVRLVS